MSLTTSRDGLRVRVRKRVGVPRHIDILCRETDLVCFSLLLVLMGSTALSFSRSVWAEVAIIPVYIAALSFLLLTFQVSRRIFNKRFKADASPRVVLDASTPGERLNRVSALGGLYTASLTLLRVVSTLGLFGLQVYTLILYGSVWVQLALAVTYVSNLFSVLHYIGGLCFNFPRATLLCSRFLPSPQYLNGEDS